MQKPALSLKQFMLRAEILKLYRGFLRLGKFLNEPPSSSNTSTNDVAPGMSGSTGNLESAQVGSTGSLSNVSIPSSSSNTSSERKKVNPMRTEWNDWVRSEFRLRQASSTDEEMTKALLGYGKRQLQEMERSIMLATNLNKPDEADKSDPVKFNRKSEKKTKTAKVEGRV